MHLRLATIADYSALHRVRMAVHENQLSDPAKVTYNDYSAMLDSRGRGWVCEEENEVVGFAIADLQTAGIWALFVLPGYEGRGIGKQLHQTMISWCFEQTQTKLQELWLCTDPNTRAEAFYRRAGWRVTGTEANGEIRFTLTKQYWLEQQNTIAE